VPPRRLAFGRAARPISAIKAATVFLLTVQPASRSALEEYVSRLLAERTAA
jgi:hypothetical protein